MFFYRMYITGIASNPQGKNLLDGGAPMYSIYQSKDRKFFAVGCIEPKFFKLFVQVRAYSNKHIGTSSI